MLLFTATNYCIVLYYPCANNIIKKLIYRFPRQDAHIAG